MDEHLEDEAKSVLFALASASDAPAEGVPSVDTITLPDPISLPEPRTGSVL
jgi:hypothetical protein